MSQAPQAFMIYKEELEKAKLEKARLRKEYEAKISELSEEMSVLKEKMSSQEDMMKSALNYAMELESRLEKFKEQVNHNEKRNGFGYH